MSNLQEKAAKLDWGDLRHYHEMYCIHNMLSLKALNNKKREPKITRLPIAINYSLYQSR